MRKSGSINNQTNHDLPGAFAGTDQYMPHNSLPGRFIISTNAILLHKVKHGVYDQLACRISNRTIAAGNDLMRTTGIKTCDQISLFIITNRVLRFVAIIVWDFHSHDRFHNNLIFVYINPADAPETIRHFFLLPLQLLFIAAVLQLASTARSCHRTFRFNAERRRLYNF